MSSLSYLLSGGEMPFTAADVRADLDLIDPRFDRTINAKIAHAVITAESKCRTCLREQVWAIQRRFGAPLSQFFAAAHRIGRIARIGAAYPISLNSGDRLGVFHDVTFAPDLSRLGQVRRAVVNWCWDEFDISSAILRERRGGFRLEWPRGRGDQIFQQVAE